MPADAENEKIVITKLDAARRQLKTAIRLWFDEADPVSIQALSFAAYDVLHSLAKRRGAKNLIFDSRLVKEEHRKEWVSHFRSAAIFFKHADRNPDGVIEFNTVFNEMYILFSCAAVHKMGEKFDTEENAFVFYLSHLRPEALPDTIKESIPPEVLEQLRRTPKRKFFQHFHKVAKLGLFQGEFTFEP